MRWRRHNLDGVAGDKVARPLMSFAAQFCGWSEARFRNQATLPVFVKMCGFCWSEPQCFSTLALWCG